MAILLNNQMKPDGAASCAIVMGGRAMALMALLVAQWFAVDGASSLAMAMALLVARVLPFTLWQ